MTVVTFLTEEAPHLSGLMSKGHSGWAGAGEDIVCAAVTSAVRLVESTVNDVMGLCASVKVREKDAQIFLSAARRTGRPGREHLSESPDGADGISDPASRRVSRITSK